MKGGPNPGPSTWKDHHGCGRYRIGVVGEVGDITAIAVIAVIITITTSITSITTSIASTAANVMIRRCGSHIQRRTSTTAILQTTGSSTSTVAGGGGGEWSTHCVRRFLVCYSCVWCNVVVP